MMKNIANTISTSFFAPNPFVRLLLLLLALSGFYVKLKHFIYDVCEKLNEQEMSVWVYVYYVRAILIGRARDSC